MNITKIVADYIESHPSIKDCMQYGIVNYSSLARRLISEKTLKQKDFDAIIMAARRYPKGKFQAQENLVLDILDKSNLEIKTKMCVAILNKGVDVEDLIHLQKEARKKGEGFHIVEGTRSLTIILAEQYLPMLKKNFKHNVLNINENLAEIIVRSPKEIEDSPGLIAYLTSLLAENGINVVEFASCWTDTLLVVDESNLAKAVKLLNV